MNKFVILLSFILFSISLFAQTNLTERTQLDLKYPFTYVVPNGNLEFNNVLDYLLSDEKVEIVKNNGEYLVYTYDGGIDWLTNNDKGLFETYVYFSNNRIRSMHIVLKNEAHLKEVANHSVTFITNQTRIAPKISHISYKPKGGERYVYEWDFEDCEIWISIDDWNNTWYGRHFEINIRKK